MEKPKERIAALSANLREFVEEDDLLAQMIPEAGNDLVDLLDAIDAHIHDEEVAGRWSR